MLKKLNYCIFIFFSTLSFVNAAEIKVMSAGAVEPGIELAINQFEQTTHHHVSIQYGTGPQLNQRLSSNQVADILIAPIPLLDQQIKQTRVIDENRIAIGKVGVGITVRNQLSDPDVSTPEALKTVLLNADSVVYNEASTGIYLEKLFQEMGIGNALKAKTTRYANGEQVLMHIIKGSKNEIGFGAITEIKLFETKGLRLVAPLPAGIQNYTNYGAGLMRESPNPELAKQLLLFLSTPIAKAAYKKVGIE